MEEIDRMRWGRFLDWLLPLPEELAHTVAGVVAQKRKGNIVPYVTSWERIGIQKGHLKGLREAIELVLKAKFGTTATNLHEQIQRLDDEPQLSRFLTAVGDPTSTIESLRGLLSAGSV
jgi:hypothetical protein